MSTEKIQRPNFDQEKLQKSREYRSALAKNIYLLREERDKNLKLAKEAEERGENNLVVFYKDLAKNFENETKKQIGLRAGKDGKGKDPEYKEAKDSHVEYNKSIREDHKRIEELSAKYDIKKPETHPFDDKSNVSIETPKNEIDRARNKINKNINKENREEEKENKREERRIKKEIERNEFKNLSKYGTGTPWPTVNKKVAYYIEKIFTANMSKGEHWKILGEFGKDLSKKGGEILTTITLKESNKKKIKSEIEKVINYPGFVELIKKDKVLKKYKANNTNQVMSLIEKMQAPGFNFLKDEKDKIKNDEKKIIRRAIDIYNYYRNENSTSYKDDKKEDDEEKAHTEANKNGKKLFKRLNRLSKDIEQEDFKKKKRDLEGIREKSNLREFIETLEKTTGLEIEEDEEIGKYAERMMSEIKDRRLMNKYDISDINNTISKAA